MRQGEERTKRLMVFSAVALAHLAILHYAVQSKYQGVSTSLAEATLVLLSPPPPTVSRRPVSIEPFPTIVSGLGNSEPRPPQVQMPEDTNRVPLADGSAPATDWGEELKSAAALSLAIKEKESKYRDLAALTPAQKQWLAANHYQPAKPGIAWAPRRVEISEGGFPIIHISDNCIAIPFLMMMVFCKF